MHIRGSTFKCEQNYWEKNRIVITKNYLLCERNIFENAKKSLCDHTKDSATLPYVKLINCFLVVNSIDEQQIHVHNFTLKCKARAEKSQKSWGDYFFATTHR